MERLTKILVKLIAWFLVSVWFAKKISKHFNYIFNDMSEVIYDLFLNFRISEILTTTDLRTSCKPKIQPLIFKPTIPPNIKSTFEKCGLNIDSFYFNDNTLSLILKVSCKKCKLISKVSILAERDIYQEYFAKDHAIAIREQCECYNIN